MAVERRHFLAREGRALDEEVLPEPLTHHHQVHPRLRAAQVTQDAGGEQGQAERIFAEAEDRQHAVLRLERRQELADRFARVEVVLGQHVGAGAERRAGVDAGELDHVVTNGVAPQESAAIGADHPHGGIPVGIAEEAGHRTQHGIDRPAIDLDSGHRAGVIAERREDVRSAPEPDHQHRLGRRLEVGRAVDRAGEERRALGRVGWERDQDRAIRGILAVEPGLDRRRQEDAVVAERMNLDPAHRIPERVLAARRSRSPPAPGGACARRSSRRSSCP